MKTLEQMQQLMNTFEFHQSASFWLKTAITELEKRDPVDALRDIEFLHALFTEKFRKGCNGVANSMRPSPFNKQ